MNRRQIRAVRCALGGLALAAGAISARAGAQDAPEPLPPPAALEPAPPPPPDAVPPARKERAPAPPLPPPPPPSGSAPPLSAGPPPPPYPMPGYGVPPYYAAPPPAFYYGTPAPTPQAEPTTRRRSTGMMVTGIVLTGLGAVSFLYGGAVLSGDGKNCSTLLGSAQNCNQTNQEAVGAVMMIAGGVLIAVGIPLLIVGGTKVRVEPPKEHASLRPTVLVGPRAGALRWSF